MQQTLGLSERALVFKGGTALRKAYFADYRFSADLDFTGRQPADEQVLRSEIEAAAATVEQGSGILFRPVRWEKTLDFAVKTEIIAQSGEKKSP